MREGDCWLLIDAGNSRIKWGWATADGISQIDLLDNQKIDSLLPAILSRHAAPSRIWLANSAGKKREQQIKNIVEILWGIDVHSIRATEQFGDVSNGYHKPEQLGADRWLGMIAAWEKINGAFCVIDCGTAVTIDLVDGKGKHQGGIIVPGIGVSSQEFATKVRHLPSDRRSSEVFSLGKSTEEGLRLEQDGSVGNVDTIVGEILSHNKNIALVATGGGARQMHKESRFKFHDDPNLVLKGLFLVANTTISQ